MRSSLLIAAALVAHGFCQNAEPGKQLHDLREPQPASAEEPETWRDDDTYVSPAKVKKPPTRPAEAASTHQVHETLLLPVSRAAASAVLHSDTEAMNRAVGAKAVVGSSGASEQQRRRKKRKPGWRRDEMVLGGRRLSKALQAESAAARGWADRVREERRRRRRSRKRPRLQRLEAPRGDERSWTGASQLDSLHQHHKQQQQQQHSFADELSGNPLNLSSTTAGTTRLLERSNASWTSEPRPSSYRTQPSQVERDFSRHVERELSSGGQLDDWSPEPVDHDELDELDEEEEEEEEEALPSLDESYDPGRMLGYSRTDEDLPIIDMENELLQRSLDDYNAYKSSSLVGSPGTTANTNAKGEKMAERSRWNLNESSRWLAAASRSSSSETVAAKSLTNQHDQHELRGDVSCMDGTFVPAPLVHHAVIKYLKSSRPGHEYLEADYECEPGYGPAVGGGRRLVCRARRWLGRLPVCTPSPDRRGASCAELGCEQLCRIVAGRAECLCREGFAPRGHSCVDVDECAGNAGRGPCEGSCRNEAGGYTCSCGPGRRLAADRHTCELQRPEDPCGSDNAGCSHTCLASVGRVFCLCPDGFVLGDDWKTCQDVDECAVTELQTEDCRHGCVNTPGSYRCVPPLRPPALPQELPLQPVQCQSGYHPATSNTCVDINECDMNNGGCGEVCENTEGSYFCACEGDERILTADKKTCVVADVRGLERMERVRLRSDVSCTRLNPVGGRGYLLCSDEPRLSGSDEEEDEEGEEKEPQPIQPGTKCQLKCPHGYELHGEYELTCRQDGTWNGPKHGECLRYSKPRLECPKDVTAELAPGKDEAFVTYEQPSTELDWFRYVRSKPSWGTRLEANLKRGLHQVTFLARHPVSKKQTSCTLNITVQEGQAPKVKGCPSDIEVTGKNGSAITWIEPTFTDNVNVTRITSNQSPGRTFSIGGHKVEYEASDEAGWTTKCTFTVVLRQPPDQSDQPLQYQRQPIDST